MWIFVMVLSGMLSGASSFMPMPLEPQATEGDLQNGDNRTDRMITYECENEEGCE